MADELENVPDDPDVEPDEVIEPDNDDTAADVGEMDTPDEELPDAPDADAD